ncbi:MAG TPA: thiopurine S-methyltransferase [Steroidobacteraceae bacterium]|jgi:thiopurine S-methyltransferase|nr:thiopurine S-methyltransferase [Steroidobacteraceae bacterium]
MEADFWHERWHRNQLGFHEPHANPLLIAHFDAMALPAGSRIFVPLCGKTLDIHWLLSRGHRVAGAELSRIAVQQLFEGLGITPHTTRVDELTRYSAPDIDIFQGDIFDLSRSELREVDAIYDRAALIALPEPLRSRYARHLAEITDRARQLVICVNYEQQRLAGPPFSVNAAEVARLYEYAYELKALGSADVVGGLKGKCPATEDVWLLAPLR